MPVRLGPRVLAMTSRHRGLFQKASYLKKHSSPGFVIAEKSSLRRDAQPARETRALPRITELHLPTNAPVALRLCGRERCHFQRGVPIAAGAARAKVSFNHG
jgi:hypothetical protein